MDLGAGESDEPIDPWAPGGAMSFWDGSTTRPPDRSTDGSVGRGRRRTTIVAVGAIIAAASLTTAAVFEAWSRTSSDTATDTRTESATQTVEDRTVGVCFFVTAAADRFASMRNDPDGTTGSPPIAVLTRIRADGPDELAAATEQLVPFVDAFVSPEQPDSQRIENWPAGVQAGVVAIDDFVADHCAD